MKELTVKEYCQLESLKADLKVLIDFSCQYRETKEGDLTILEFMNSQGQVIKEIILVF